MNAISPNVSPRVAAGGCLTPAERWLSALRMDGTSAVAELRAAYKEHSPVLGELVFTGACEFECQHCVYPPSYGQLNRELSVSQWKDVLGNIARNLGIQTFIYGGRSLTAKGVEVLTWLREWLPQASIGVIDNGVSMRRVSGRLASMRLDWIDISLDGLESEHDLQRGCVGSYRAGLEGALWLAESGLAPKVNILTCLTSLNCDSITRMLRELNEAGIKNFFITPVTIVDGVRPSPALRPSEGAFGEFLEELRSVTPMLDGAWVEVTVYSAGYAANIARQNPRIWQGLQTDRDGLTWHEQYQSSGMATPNELYIRYYPVSLSGTRELIVNTNGDVMVPKAVAAGQISDDHIAGNLLEDSAYDVVSGLTESRVFSFYEQELLHERELLREYVS